MQRETLRWAGAIAVLLASQQLAASDNGDEAEILPSDKQPHVIWKYINPYSNGLSNATVRNDIYGSASDGHYFYQSMFDQCRVIAIDCNSGQIKWTFNTQGWVSPSPSIADNRLFIGCQDKHVYCLDSKSGALLWKFRTGSRISSTAAVRDDSVWVPSCDGHLYRIRVTDSSLVWKFPIEAGNRTKSIYSRPLIAQNLVMFAAGEGHIYGVHRDSGKLAWKICPSPNSELFTSLATDGTRLWAVSRKETEERGESAVIAIGW